MCQEIAIVTMKVLGTCTLYDRVRSNFEALAKGGNCVGMQEEYRRLLREQPLVGHSIALAGETPLESVEDLMGRLSGLSCQARPCGPAPEASLEAANEVLDEALSRLTTKVAELLWKVRWGDWKP